MLLGGRPEMKVEGIEVWAVSRPDELGPSADDFASEFFSEEGLGHVGAVRGGFILHPPEISSCC